MPTDPTGAGASSTLALAFPGQGSLAPGIGTPWRDHEAFGVVRRVGDHAGRDLVRLLTSADEAELISTENAQLCTFALSLCVLQASGLATSASFALGHSLGEYTALVAAGVLDEPVAAELVGVRGRAMRAAADASPGTLAALLGVDLEGATKICAAIDGLSIANVNGPGQVVVGGSDAAIAQLELDGRSLGARRVVRLKVGGAFHTELMAPALVTLGPALAAAQFRSGHARVVANVDGEVHDDPAEWPVLLQRQLVEPVRFDECVEALPSGVHVVECGPGKVLQGLIGRIREDVTVTSIGAPEELAALADAG